MLNRSAFSTHTRPLRASRAARLGACASLLLLGALGASACVSGADEELLGVAALKWGSYDLTSSYTGTVGDTRGWIIEWEVPELLNESTAWMAVGQWYYGLESGIYHTPEGWFVYYFGDDNGLAGNHPNCGTTWSSGSTCGGTLGGNLGYLQPGQQLVFKYERCTPAHVADVNGSVICLYVDMKDGTGWQFLAEDAPGTVEMYTHDVEHWADDGYVTPQISCEDPIKMLRQERKTAAGVWEPMSSASTWAFNQAAPYAYQNRNLTASPSTWEACTPPPDGSGNGLRGEYFSNTSLSGTPLVRTDPAVNFDWGSGSPAGSIPADDFSVRWTGEVEPRYSETYTFSTLSDDGVRLWVNGALLIDNWTPHSPTLDSATISLAAGQRYDLKLEYFESSVDAVSKLYWSSPSQVREVIPKGRLHAAGPSCSGAPAWASAQVYSPGTQVTEGGHLWTATQQIWWSNPACPPSAPASWCPAEWADLGACN
ncbi:PA14 domain-containing protein [Sorangium sp. So ce1153]|uniref:PA14 domain-containing protein n=1 Tax=Sorangium sp. So ce1153 TaxID=3133333 RepID=UPI003F5DFEFE